MVGHASRRRALARADAELDRREGRHVPIVYYMRMDRLVKIGTTMNIAQRIASIMPQGVIALEFGGRTLERERHRQFVEHHSHREWYWLRESIVQHVVAVRESFAEVAYLSTEEWLALRGAQSTALGEPST